MRFRRTIFAPPGGRWFYTVPETGRYVESVASLAELVRDVASHYAINELPAPSNLGDLIQHYMCLRLPPGFCEGDDPRSESEMPLTFFQVVGKSEKYFRSVKQFVEYKEAQLRSKVCKSCPSNDIGMCTNCNGLRGLARRLCGGRQTAYDAYLGVCREARLPVNGLVHVSRESLPRLSRTPPSMCWMSRETTNA